MNTKKLNNNNETKREYKKLQLKKIGDVRKLTLKTGSQADFGANHFSA